MWRFLVSSVVLLCSTVGFCMFTITKQRFTQNLPDLDLNGEWMIENGNGSIFKVVTVPGGVYSDLMKLGFIPDIYFGNNDVDTRWVAFDGWKYYRSFYASEEWKKTGAVFLTFDGVDTVSSIYVNGKIVGKTDNMFVRYSFNVSDELIEGTNKIVVKFKSPVTAALKRYEAEKVRRNGTGVPPKCTPAGYNGECHANHLRKQQASFSWDWGPAFPGSGIWRNVRLEMLNVPILRDINVFVGRNWEKDQTWLLNVIMYFEGIPQMSYSVVLTIELKDSATGQVIFSKDTSVEIVPSAENGEFSFAEEFVLSTSDVQTWWPNGYGEQPVYNLTVQYAKSRQRSVLMGFRTIELIDEPLETSKGNTFYFLVNNVPIFMKGSNWIPANILPENGTTDSGKQVVHRLLLHAKMAHMNMLRVWGGGVYETDYFYETADRMGILIWQDFMFACSMYPANDEFLKSVNTEITQQVRRLQSHPSIALWAGNNENELALRQNWYGTLLGYNGFKKDYIKLYVETIKPIVELVDPSRAYVISSPSNGKKSEEDGYIAKKPGDPLYGDVHFYNYISAAWKRSMYPNPRFASEYGLQSLPNYWTLRSATESPETDLVRGSAFLQHRQHHPLGYIPINLQIEYQFPKTSYNNSYNCLKDYIYQSQIIQAMAMKVETEKYRQLRSVLLDSGEGLTMGALYWQLNDVWQAPSWSSIDFGGRLKMLHYYACNFFAPVLVSGFIDLTGDLNVYVISDRQNPIENAHLQISIYKWSDVIPIQVLNLTTDIAPLKSALAYKQNLKTLLKSPLEDCFVYLSLTSGESSPQKLSPDNFVLLSPLKDINGLKRENITVNVTQMSTNDFRIQLKTNGICLFVWLETYLSGYFSDNGMLMVQPEMSIDLKTDLPQDIETVRVSLLMYKYNDYLLTDI